MLSAIGEKALIDSLNNGRAVLKFISANDVGLTGSHQYGFYLPKAVWNYYSPHPPEDGINSQHEVTITWPDGLETNSRVYWYGRGSRSEYRLTRFGNNFPWISWNTSQNVGDLLLIIPHSIREFSAFVLDLEEDIDEILTSLGVEINDAWGVYDSNQLVEESEDACLNRLFREFAQELESLPSGQVFSNTTTGALKLCIEGFDKINPDSKLLRLVTEEFNLYKMSERVVFEPEVQRLFASIDDFLKTANSILQSRKSRAGRSLENHVEYLLRTGEIPFDSQPNLDDTKPDIVIPGKVEYDDPTYPLERLFVLGVKRTCKDRWRQVTAEAPRLEHKYILTLQRGISSNQMQEMNNKNVSLIVPESYHRDYPPDTRDSLLTVQRFIDLVRQQHPND